MWEFLLHRMIPKEQKEPVMAVPGDLADPGKVTPVLCLFGPRLWPFESALLAPGLASKWGFHSSP